MEAIEQYKKSVSICHKMGFYSPSSEDGVQMESKTLMVFSKVLEIKPVKNKATYAEAVQYDVNFNGFTFFALFDFRERNKYFPVKKRVENAKALFESMTQSEKNIFMDKLKGYNIENE